MGITVMSFTTVKCWAVYSLRQHHRQKHITIEGELTTYSEPNVPG
jgi:hypothetical protein